MTLHRLGHAFEQGDIHVGGVPGPGRPDERAPSRGQEGQRGVHAAHVLTDPTTDRDRRPLGKAPEPRGATQGLQHELGRRALLPWPAPAEVGQREHQHSRMDRRQGGRIAADGFGPPAVAGEHDCVGPPHELGQAVPIAHVHHRALRAGAEIREERVLPAEGVAFPRFHLDHLGPCVHQQLRAVRPGDPITQVEDPQTLDGRPALRHVTPGPVEGTGRPACSLHHHRRERSGSSRAGRAMVAVTAAHRSPCWLPTVSSISTR